MKAYLLLMTACTSLLLTSCASITEGRTQNLTVETTPDGAHCDLFRDSEKLGVINPTPGTLLINKSKHDIELLCQKEGYLDEKLTIVSETEGMTFGNALLGGVIGIAIDSSTGAANQYAGMVELDFTPKQFLCEQQRDAFFSAQDQVVIERFQGEVDKINDRCEFARPNQKKLCDKDIQALEELKQEELQAIAEIKALTGIDASADTVEGFEQAIADISSVAHCE